MKRVESQMGSPSANADNAHQDMARVSTWRMRIARRTEYLTWPFEKLLKFAKLFQTGLPVGLLSREDIARTVWQSYAEVPGFYNPGRYHMRYEEQLLPLLDHFLSKDAPTERRLLDLYCGHGREAEIFARGGYTVTGIDVQPEVIQRARDYATETGFDAEFLVGDLDAWEPPDQAWDVVYTSLWMYSTIPDCAERLAWIERFSRWIAPDGVMVFSVMPRSPNFSNTVRHAIARITAAITLNSRWPELGDRFENCLFWHDFTEAEVEQELASSRVEVLDKLEIGGGTPCIFYVVRSGDPVKNPA